MKVKLTKDYNIGDSHMHIDTHLKVFHPYTSHVFLGDGKDFKPGWAVAYEQSDILFVVIKYGLDQNLSAGAEIIITDTYPLND